MHCIQRVIGKQRDAATVLKNKLFQGEVVWNNDRMGKLQSATLRRLMNKEVTQKPTRQSILSKRKEIELVKFKVMLLCQEKTRKIAILRNKTRTSKTLYDENCLKSELNHLIFNYV